MLGMHERALDLRNQLIQADINNELGQDSPHYRANNIQPDYDEYIRLRLLVKQTPTRRSENRSPGGNAGGRGEVAATSRPGRSTAAQTYRERAPRPSESHATGSWQANPHGLPELAPGMAALDSIFEAAFEEAQARMNQEPRSAATPEINAMFDRWSAKIAHWMQVHDYTIPPPQMDDELWKALEHDAKYDPDVNQWFHTAKNLQRMHEQAKDMAQFTQALQSPGRKAGGQSKRNAGGQSKRNAGDNNEPENKSPGREAGGRGESPRQQERTSCPRSKLAKIIPGPGNPHFNTRA
jgi:hypothetical protein